MLIGCFRGGHHYTRECGRVGNAVNAQRRIDMSSRDPEEEIRVQTERIKQLFMVLVFVLTLGGAAAAQVINYPVGAPTSTSGAGNARTDPDNFFLRNNIGGMTEIPSRAEEERGGPITCTPTNQWHFQ